MVLNAGAAKLVSRSRSRPCCRSTGRAELGGAEWSVACSSAGSGNPRRHAQVVRSKLSCVATVALVDHLIQSFNLTRCLHMRGLYMLHSTWESKPARISLRYFCQKLGLKGQQHELMH
jgi:hypothetical protein